MQENEMILKQKRDQDASDRWVPPLLLTPLPPTYLAASATAC